MAIKFDIDLTPEDVAQLTSADALAALVQRMGYDTGKRAVVPAQAVGLDGNSDIQHHYCPVISPVIVTGYDHA